MSSRDRTREKLVGSMKKTKAVAGIGNERTEAEPGSPGQEPSAPVKTTVRRGTDRASAPRPETVNFDAYQSGGRVWPD